MDGNRRALMQSLALILSASPARLLFANEASTGNFAYIYSDPAIREQFKKFLINVFHLYPQDDLHALILRAVKQELTDEGIYRQVQARLGDVKPFLGDLTRTVPASFPTPGGNRDPLDRRFPDAISSPSPCPAGSPGPPAHREESS